MPKITVHKNGNIIIDTEKTENMLKFFYSLKLSYLREVNEFKIFHLFMKRPTVSILTISNSLYLSLSYTRKILKKLNLFLNSFQFQIVEKKGICEKAGNELSIRLFLYVLMNDTYNSLPWPYTIENLPKRMNYRQSLHIMLSILISRQKYNKVVSDLNENNHWIIRQLRKAYDFIALLKLENIFLEDELQDPLIEEYFIFFGHLCAPQAIPKCIKIQLGQIFSKAPKGMNKFTISLYNKIIKKFRFTHNEEKKYLLIYYLTILICFYEIMQETSTLFEGLIFPHLEYLSLFEQPEVKKIMSFFQEFLIEESYEDLLNKHKLQQYFCGLIYTILQVEKVPSIRIYLYFTKDLTAQDLIQAKLESVYNTNTVLFTNCIEESDLIVTDSLNFDKK